jgi:hypothetical protein
VKVDECWDENVMFQIEADGGYERSNGKPFSTLISYLLVFITTLALGSRPKQGLARVQAKKEARESHFMLPRV